MAKEAQHPISYEICGEFKVIGNVNKHDIIGSFYGQTEGLLGDELELQILQNQGKLGRIDIKLKNNKDITTGNFIFPVALHKVEVSLVAAAIESIEKIATCDSVLKITALKDIRTDKRELILKRAEELLKTMQFSTPKSSIMKKSMSTNPHKVKSKEIAPEIYTGIDFFKSKEIFIVEGKADVDNLIENNINNCISCNGLAFPQEFFDLIKNKKCIGFFDGDKGGKKIYENLSKKIKFEKIFFAPNNKEVELLSSEEIKLSLENKDNTNNEIKEEKNKEIIKNNNQKIIEHKNKDFFDKTQIISISKILPEIENSKDFIILNKKGEIISKGNVCSILQSDLRKGFILIFNGTYEKSISKKLENSQIKVVLTPRKSYLKNLIQPSISFLDFKKVIE